ncbi:unnamed protein product [Effrenium voratum]|nr:unnamed protein product [Effrenium voratum]
MAPKAGRERREIFSKAWLGALRPPEPVQPQVNRHLPLKLRSVASAPVRTETGPETFLEAETIGPGEPAMQPGAQVQRKAALEEMHREIGQLMAAGNRIHTFYDLKCQQLREYYDEELHRVSVALSSNREVWEGVSEARERQRLLSEEIQRSARRCDEAKSEARHMQKAIDEHEEFTKKMFDWKKKMLKAQGDLQHEMRKYERDGLVDVSKMESELGKLDTQLQQLSTSVPAEQLVALLWRRGRGERLRLRRVMHHEGKLLHKAAAKVQVIRTELEKGVQELEDEPFSELLMEECETLSRKIMKLDQENLELQDQILKTGRGEVDLVQHPRPSEPRPMLPMSLPKPRRIDPESLGQEEAGETWPKMEMASFSRDSSKARLPPLGRPQPQREKPTLIGEHERERDKDREACGRPSSVLSSSGVLRRREPLARLDPLASGRPCSDVFSKSSFPPKPFNLQAASEAAKDGRALAAELAGQPKDEPEDKTQKKAQAVASLQRLFFEELKGCGDRNAAAATALRRLAEEDGITCP